MTNQQNNEDAKTSYHSRHIYMFTLLSVTLTNNHTHFKEELIQNIISIIESQCLQCTKEFSSTAHVHCGDHGSCLQSLSCYARVRTDKHYIALRYYLRDRRTTTPKHTSQHAGICECWCPHWVRRKASEEVWGKKW